MAAYCVSSEFRHDLKPTLFLWKLRKFQVFQILKLITWQIRNPLHHCRQEAVRQHRHPVQPSAQRWDHHLPVPSSPSS